jgi:choline-sulfatase
MVSDGVIFDSFYANSALCGPCRFSTYTGQMPFYNANWANPNCVKVPFLPYMGHYFLNAGFYTGSIGKLHGMPEDFDFGFEHCRHNWGLRVTFPFNDYGNWVRNELRGRPDAEKLLDTIQRKRADGHTTPDEDYYFIPQELSEEAWLLNETESFLQSAPSDRPFLLNLCIQHPHEAWETIPSEDERYDEASIPLPPNYMTRTPITDEVSRPGNYLGDVNGWTDANWRRFIARYYTSVTQVDKAIGRVFSLLAEYGHADDTIVVLNSDHGEMLSEFGRTQKALLYEAAVRQPFIAWGAGVPSSQRRDQLGEQIDILPTLMDYANLAVPSGLPGISLKNVIEDGSRNTKPWVHVWLEFNGRIHAMVCSGRYKLYRLSGTNHAIGIREQIELCDLIEDPSETKNIWPGPDTAEVRALKQEFCDYFWRHAGMMGCPPEVRQELCG